MAASEEIVWLVNEKNEPLGGCPRSRMRKENLLHRSTYIFIVNERGEFYVQKRTATKDYCPSYFDLASGGVVQENESYEDNARRELKEELGIEVPLQNLGEFLYEDSRCRTWGGLFLGVFNCEDLSQLHLQAEEVESIHLMSASTIQEQIRLGAKITPDSIHAFNLLQQHQSNFFV